MTHEPKPVGESFACYDCGGLFPLQDTGGTGYATLTGASDPSEAQHVVCYACADARERADMAKASKFFGYLSQDGNRIQTWSGGHLAYVTSETTRKVGGGFGYFQTERTYVRATDRDGAQWYGNGPGRGMYVRLRRKVSR